MDELIARLTAAANIDPATALKACGAILAFLEKEGPAHEVARVVESIKGAQDVVNDAMGSTGGGGGLLATLGGMFGHMSGGLTGLGGQLMGMGLDLPQIQTVGRTILAFASEKAGADVVGKIVNEIPGLEQFV